ncbi:FIST N-terminal domain-containing protein [Pannus brasiliensis CCIBt3594]|uniref:FIST N-terminal domain-containing protein n=1 Tax=Pannus brasiliensis CCIBt3594 TaxID=1427578 RepID=A0AAW9R095_9CHRO
MSDRIQWINALSTRPSLEAAVSEVVEKIKRDLEGPADLGMVFISSAYASDYPRLVPLLLDKLSLPVLIGCGGAGIVGTGGEGRSREIEGNPALSLTVARLPNVEIRPLYLEANDYPDLDSSPDRWTELIGVAPEKNPHFILLADPFSSRITDLLEGLDFAYAGSVKIGGLVSGGMLEQQGGLFFHDENRRRNTALYRQGVVGVALSGDIVVETIVAQGCRPIGQTYQITEGERNIILEMSATDKDSSPNPPLNLLRDLIQTLSDKDRELAQHSLFIGIARDEFKMQLRSGDFLIRNVLGVDPRHGAIAIGDRVRPGQRVQFHLRDADTSALDLELLLESYRSEREDVSAIAGALMFSCLGRGETLYEKPDFDSGLFQRYLGAIPLSGFFCNGEIGPVGGRTFLHGYTSAFALFRPGRGRNA